MVKHMKKAISLILVIILIASVTVPALSVSLGKIDTITIEAPDKSIAVTLTNAADKVVEAYGNVYFFLYDDGTLSFSQDVKVYNAATQELTYAGTIKAGQEYTYAEYSNAIKSFLGVTDGSYSYSIDSKLNPININSYDNYTGLGEVKDITAYSLQGGGVVTAPAPTSIPEITLSDYEIIIPGLEDLYTFDSNSNGVKFGEQTIKLSSVPNFYYYSEGTANVVSEHSSVHFGDKNYIFLIPKDGYFSFESVFEGFIDSAQNYWDSLLLSSNIYNNGVDAVIKIRLENNAAMEMNVFSSAVNLFFVLTSDLSQSYGEKRNISELAISGSVLTDTTPSEEVALSAKPSKTVFVMNGETVSVPQAYNVNDNNYLQLRAIAVLLNGTEAQFNVSWDGKYAVIETGKPYVGEANAATLAPTTDVRKSSTKFKIDGELAEFEKAYLIDGDTNYLQLREFASKLTGTKSQFNIYYDEVLKQAVIEPGKPYTGVK